MRKRDFLYVHALCVLARREIEARRTVSEEAFAAYEDVDVRPTSVHRQKSEHKRAILALLDDLSSAVDGRDDGQEPTPPLGWDEPK